MVEEKKKKDIKLTKSAPNDLKDFVGIAEYNREYERSAGTYIDIKLLKRAILWVQSERPDAKSFRITSIDTNSLPFLVIETKDQDTEGARKEAFVISPLTTHVDRAEKFADVTIGVYMQPEQTTSPTVSGGSGGFHGLFSDIAKELGSARETASSPDIGVKPALFTGIGVVGSEPAPKKRTRTRKTKQE